MSTLTLTVYWVAGKGMDGSLRQAWAVNLPAAMAAGWVYRVGLRRLCRKTAPIDWSRDPRKRNSTPTRRAIWRELAAATLALAMLAACGPLVRQTCDVGIWPHPSGKPKPAGTILVKCDGKVQVRIDADSVAKP